MSTTTQMSFSLARVAAILTAIGTGALLLVAAGLKIYSHSESPPPLILSWLAIPEIETFGVVWEVGLGLWLLSGRFRLSAMLAALVTFASFAVVNLSSALQGERECACLGYLRSHPWLTFTLDLVVLAALSLALRYETKHRSLRAEMRPVGFTLFGCGVCLTLFIAILVWRYGTVANGFAALQGKSLVAAPIWHLGQHAPNELVTVALPMTNTATETLRIVGCTSDCSCIAVSQLPTEIPRGSKQDLTITIKLPPTEQKRFRKRVDFWYHTVDNNTMRTASVTITSDIE